WILQAKSRATELLGREAELRDLWGWLEAAQPIAGRLLVGRAGSGKTRLGLDFVWQVFRKLGDRWDVGMVTGETLLKERDWEAWVWRRPTLLLVDYAQTIERPLRRLFRGLSVHGVDPSIQPLRFLLLERVASAKEGWFRDLLDIESGAAGVAVRQLFLPPEPVPLQPVAATEMRRSLLEDVLQMASKSDGRPSPMPPKPGADPSFDAALKHDRWSDPLYLMMAGLAARENALFGTGSPGTALRSSLHLGRVDLAKEIARREIRRLDRFVPPEKGESGVRMFRHLAALATAVGGLTLKEARDVVLEETTALGRIWTEGPADLVERLHDALPGEDASVAPIEPDIVAEALVLAVWTDRLSRAEQVALVLRCARRRVRAMASMLLHGLQDFVRSDSEGGILMFWLDAIIEEGIDSEPGFLIAMERILPEESVALRERALQISESIYRNLRKRLDAEACDNATKADLARLASNLAVRLAELGRRPEALGPAEESLKLSRELAEHNPDAYMPGLARSLNSLANVLGKLGRSTDAMGLAEEAVGIQRYLAERNPDAFTPGLAMSLNNYAIQLNNLGRDEDALGPSEEAARLYQELAEHDPEAFIHDLAMSLSNLAIGFGKLGRRNDALSPAVEAVKHYRDLARRNPDAFTPALASALNTLANSLGNLGRKTEALSFAEEVAKLYRELVDQNHDAFTPDLAMSLTNLALRLSEVGRTKEAVGFNEEGMNLYRELAEKNPAEFKPALAMSLNNLALRLGRVGRESEALGLAVEATMLRRELAAEWPDAYTHELASSLNNLSNRLYELGQKTEALKSADEAVSLFRALEVRNPGVFKPNLATSLSTLANRLSESGRRMEALSLAKEAVNLRRELASQDPDAFMPELAVALEILGRVQEATGDSNGAISSYSEGLRLLAQALHSEPEAYSFEFKTLARDYVRVVTESGRVPDGQLLDRVIDVINRMKEEEKRG
ncbi:MAG: tetratricopeptide repeat protein, partial [Limisphaerales bacterium]